jgi:hypothetical protein
MKSLVFVIIVALFAQYTTAQKIKMTRMDSLAYDLAYTKYNVGKFKKQMITGYCIASIGFVGLVANSALNTQPAPTIDYTNANTISKSYGVYSGKLKDYNDKVLIGNLLCGAAILVGTIVTLDSYSWLSRASIKPSQYGVSFTYDLDIEE